MPSTGSLALFVYFQCSRACNPWPRDRFASLTSAFGCPKERDQSRREESADEEWDRTESGQVGVSFGRTMLYIKMFANFH